MAPTLGGLVWFSPLGLPWQAHRLAAIFTAIVIAWITEFLPIPVTALLVAPLLVLAGVTDAQTAFQPYADPLLFLFVGGFFIAQAMMRHSLDVRLATGLVGLPGVRGRPARGQAMMLVAAMLLSMWISNTASTAILMPILIGLLQSRRNEPTRAETGIVLALAYACSVGGLGTLVGSPPNLITARFLRESGRTFGFVEWLQVGLPAALVLVVVVYLVCRKLYRFHEEDVAEQAASPTARAWSRGERVTALAFGLAVVGWVVPGVLTTAGVPGAQTLSKMLPSGGVALLAASVLFMMPDHEGERVLPWPEAMKIDWGIIFLFGGGISLGLQMFETGLAEAISRGFVAFTGVKELWTLTALVTVFTIFFTETCSNMASATMLVPLVMAAAREMGVSPMPPALAVGLAASCAFMLPIATGPNAIVYGTGRVTIPDMLRTGVVLNLLSALLIFLLLRVLCPLYGWS